MIFKNFTIKKEWSLIIAIILFIDQLSKILVSTYMLKGQEYSLISNFLSFSYITNTGIAFGWQPFKGQLILFFFATIIAIFFVLKILSDSIKDSFLTQFSLCLILGGALGNFIDRLFMTFKIMNYEGVIDFINISLFIKFPYTFNFADTFISIGIFLYIISFIRLKFIDAKR